MKVYLEEQEWWPVLCLSDNKNDFYSCESIEVPEELYLDYKKAATAFHNVQSKIEKIRDGNS